MAWLAWEKFSSLAPGVVQQTTPVYRPQGSPKVPAYDPFVRPNPLEFAAAQGQVVVKEVIFRNFSSLVIFVSFLCLQITSKCLCCILIVPDFNYPSSSNTTHSLDWIFFQRPSPALHDLPSPDLTSNTPIVKRQPQQKFFPRESKTQDENSGFMNDPVPFTSSIGSLHSGAPRPERSEAKTQVWDNLNPSDIVTGLKKGIHLQ